MNLQNKLLLLTIIPFFVSCQGHIDKKSSVNTKEYSLPIDTAFIPTNSNQLFFPLEAFSGIDTFGNTCYSKYLFALNEPIFYADKTKKEIFRFTWLRTFNNPVAIRIEKLDDTYFLYWKLSNGAGGYQPGKLIINKKKEIDKATWDKFQLLLDKIDFWNLETNVNNIGCDGSQWILEGKIARNYHVVDRWSPRDINYVKCCDFLIGLTDLKISEEDKY
jgi:hypothetical protein